MDTSMNEDDALPMRLYTFTISHFSEKIRWTLDAIDAAYREAPLVPVLHVLKARRLGGRATTVPILQADGQRIQDSTRIFEWLAEHRAPFSLMPQAGAQRDAVMAIEARFDRIGAHVIRYAYSRTLDNASAVLPLWTLDASPMQARFLRLAYPLIARLFKRQLGMSSANIEKSRTAIGESLDWIASQISEGQRYLVGGKFSVADITACALLAPLVCPDQHPVYSTQKYRAGVAELTAGWQSHPGFKWVSDTYARERHIQAGGSFAAAAAKLSI